MSELAEDYISQYGVSPRRGQAWKAWAVTLAVAAVWVLLIISPPVFGAIGISSAADSVFGFFSYICHQIPDRSFHLLGHQFGVCARCFGIYFGLVFGTVTYPLWRNVENLEPPPRFWLFLSLLPISIDWSLTFFGIWENTHVSRFLTGLILGVACVTFILPAIVEITRNVSRRKRFEVA